jgi:hypothetical protein
VDACGQATPSEPMAQNMRSVVYVCPVDTTKQYAAMAPVTIHM